MAGESDGAPVFTARMAAAMRAAHVLVDDPPVFRDDLALAFSGFEPAEITDIVGGMDPDHGSVFRLVAVVRARVADEALDQAVRDGIGQVVVLGAGMDSTAWRRADLPSSLRLLEVDHPGTQAYKRERVDAVGAHATCDHRFVPFDFTGDDDLMDALVAAGFDPDRPVLWTWLGVMVYLTEPQIVAMLRSLATMSRPGSTLVADFILDRSLMDDRARAADDFARPEAAAEGEAYLTTFGTDEIHELATGAGWADVRTFVPSDFRAWFDDRADGLPWSTYIGLVSARLP